MLKHKSRLQKQSSVIILLALTGLLWLLLLPIQFGGQAAYVIISGNSMEPGLHRGDLVVLRRASEYQVGDIATYRHPQLGPVIHRIIDRSGSRFIFKGDHNGWIDSYRPVQADLIGKFWFHIPAAGKMAEQLRTPWSITLLVSIAVVIGLTSVSTRQAKSSRRQEAKEGRKLARFPGALYESRTDLLVVLGLLLGAALLLGFFAFTRPVWRPATDNISYKQTGKFDYFSPAPPGIYQADRVEAGEPIFRQVINTVTVSFDYQFAADQVEDLQGSYRLVADIGHNNGWSQTIELQPETLFEGDTFSAQATLDLAQLQARLDMVEQQTGLHGQQYSLAICPHVTIAGVQGGQPLQEQFRPCLDFYLDPFQMRLASDNARDLDLSELLYVSQTGLLQRTRQAPNTILILGFGLPVAMARGLAAAALVISLGGGLALGWYTHQVGRADEATRIRLKYGSLLVAVQRQEPDGQVIDVATMEGLVKIAEQYGRVILYHSHNSGHHFAVRDGGLIYQYVLAREEA